jgi:hypothetical protein
MLENFLKDLSCLSNDLEERCFFINSFFITIHTTLKTIVSTCFKYLPADQTTIKFATEYGTIETFDTYLERTQRYIRTCRFEKCTNSALTILAQTSTLLEKVMREFFTTSCNGSPRQRMNREIVIDNLKSCKAMMNMLKEVKYREVLLQIRDEMYEKATNLHCKSEMLDEKILALEKPFNLNQIAIINLQQISKIFEERFVKCEENFKRMENFNKEINDEYKTCTQRLDRLETCTSYGVLQSLKALSKIETLEKQVQELKKELFESSIVVDEASTNSEVTINEIENDVFEEEEEGGDLEILDLSNKECLLSEL